MLDEIESPFILLAFLASKEYIKTMLYCSAFLRLKIIFQRFRGRSSQKAPTCIPVTTVMGSLSDNIL